MTRVIHSLWPWQSCLADDAPGQVGGLTATPSGTTTINLQWNADNTAAPNTATAYEVERSVDGLGSWSVIGTVYAPAVTFSDTTLSASTTRHYRVRATNCNSAGLESTSASATTAAGSLSPSWSLDFSSGTPSGYTLTRASSGTYVDSSGYVATSSTDVARLTHNSSGSRLGLLVESASTNNVIQSQTFDTSWALGQLRAFGSGSTANAATAPDNTTTADLITENSVNGDHGIGWLWASGPTANQRICCSVFAKKPSSNAREIIGVCGIQDGIGYFGKRFNLTTGAAVGADYNTNTTTFTNLQSGIEDYGNGWYRCWCSVQTSSAAQCGMRIALMVNSTTTFSFGYGSYTGDNTSGLLIWGAQMEYGSANPTAYIATTTASVTRSADLVHVLDSSITNWGDPGALVVHFYPPRQAGTLISTDDASTAQVGIEASTTTAARAFWSSGSTATGTIGSGVQKAVHYWNGSTSKFCINGGTVQSGTNNLTIANTDFVTLGAEATDSAGVPGTFSQYANCVIRKVEFYSGTLTDANLQTITT